MSESDNEAVSGMSRLLHSVDFWSISLSATGVLLGIAALWIAIVQLRKIATSSKAASEAAKEAVGKMENVRSIVSIGELQNSASDLLHLTQNNNYQQAYLRANDLRNSVATLRHASFAKSVANRPEWQSLVMKIRGVQETLRGLIDVEADESHTADIDSEEGVATNLHADVEEIVEQISGWSGRVTEKAVNQ